MDKNKLYKKGIIISFGELFLKSEGVKRIFRKKMENQIFYFLKENKIEYKNILSRDRIFIETEEILKTKEILNKVFGISWFSQSLFFYNFNLKDISSIVSSNYRKWVKRGETFSIRVKIEKGVIKETKEEIIEEIAEKISDRKVNLKNPSKEINIEIRKNGSFLYVNREKGLGGLPVSSSGNVLVLVSGGIDSPVASYMMSKRGANCIWVHFHSFPFVSNKSIKKVEEIANILKKYQKALRVYFIPFSEIQNDIKAKTPGSLRVLIYRRKMIEIANKIAEEEDCGALITGESLGQVSSQTLPNIAITSESSKIPILRPLISSDKEEIIEIARKIGSFDISIREQEDCCTLFVPKNSTGKGNISEIKEIESKLDKNLIKKAQKIASFVDFH